MKWEVKSIQCRPIAIPEKELKKRFTEIAKALYDGACQLSRSVQASSTKTDSEIQESPEVALGKSGTDGSI